MILLNLKKIFHKGIIQIILFFLPNFFSLIISNDHKGPNTTYDNLNNFWDSNDFSSLKNYIEIIIITMIIVQK
jgi:hypothetical protein